MITVEVLNVHKFVWLVVLLAAFAVLIGSTDATARLVGKPAPEISNNTWIHSEPLRLKDLKGKVVLLEFWTYG